MLVALREDPIALTEALEYLNHGGAGAVVMMSGLSRPTDAEGTSLSHLAYEAYREMAQREMEAICGETRERWPIIDIAMLHRVGRVGIGEPSVVIAVASAHRREAFHACQFAIDRLKETVPIWKLEVPLQTVSSGSSKGSLGKPSGSDSRKSRP
jgi:molybdopterin synthase catalytic subunit